MPKLLNRKQLESKIADLVEVWALLEEDEVVCPNCGTVYMIKPVGLYCDCELSEGGL